MNYHRERFRKLTFRALALRQSGLHQLETRPGSHPHIRLHNKLDYSTGLCLPSLQSDIENPDEVNNRPNRTNSRCSRLASSALVAGSAETPNISASVTPEQSNPLNGPDRPGPRSSNVSSSSLGRVSHLYQRFQAEGIPTNVADLLTRSSTHKLKATSVVGPLVPLVFWTAN